MNYRKCIFIVFLFFFFLLSNQHIYAMNTKFTTEEITLEEYNRILSYVSITLLNSEPEKRGIECFDVNNEGLIAIGSSNSRQKNISIYNSLGEFQYGYSFKDDGSFGLQWNGDNIFIYFVRGDISIEINSKAEIKSISKIQNTLENNTYWNHVVFASKRIIGDQEYIIQNDMGFFNIFATSYSQLILINKNSENTIIYNINEIQMSKTIIYVVGFIASFVIIIVYLFRTQIQKTKSYTK